MAKFLTNVLSIGNPPTHSTASPSSSFPSFSTFSLLPLLPFTFSILSPFPTNTYIAGQHAT